MAISRKAKEAIKTGLAMTIGYQISLSMGWDKPMWVGFTIAFVSLATVGQSFNKAAMRMMGTLVAVVASLVIIGLFAQDRWLFILSLSLWAAVCTYMMGGTKNQYFWFVAGFVCVIICVDGGPNSEHAFEIAMVRAQQTGLGILTYGLVAAILWPTNSGRAFASSASDLVSTQRRLYQAMAGLMLEGGDKPKAMALQARLVEQKNRFGQLLDAALTDTFEVRQFHQQWRTFQFQAERLATETARWMDAVAGEKSLDYGHLLIGLKPFWNEVDQRMSMIEGMLKKQAPTQEATAIKLALDNKAVRALTVFQKAALAVSRNRLQHIEELSRAQFATATDLQDIDRITTSRHAVPALKPSFIPDLDRLISSVRIMATMWLAYLAIIYIQDWPGGGSFLSMATPVGMMLAGTPQVSIRNLLVPAAVGVLVAAVAYIFVMPLISGFAALGLMIFSFTFFFCYRYADPKQALGRSFGLAMFVSIAAISNEQSYNFLAIADTALMWPLVFIVVAITAHIPFSPRPERIYLRLMKRFFRSCEYLLSTTDKESGSQMRSVYSGALVRLPQKMAGLIPLIDPKALPGTSAEQLQAIVTNLESLTSRMQDLAKFSDDAPAMDLLKELGVGISDWKVIVKNTFFTLANDPASVDKAALQSHFEGVVTTLEKRIQDRISNKDAGQVSDLDIESFYRLLGAWQSVFDALTRYARSASHIEWLHWREGRFT